MTWRVIILGCLVESILFPLPATAADVWEAYMREIVKVCGPEPRRAANLEYGAWMTCAENVVKAEQREYELARKQREREELQPLNRQLHEWQLMNRDKTRYRSSPSSPPEKPEATEKDGKTVCIQRCDP